MKSIYRGLLFVKNNLLLSIVKVITLAWMLVVGTILMTIMINSVSDFQKNIEPNVTYYDNIQTAEGVPFEDQAMPADVSTLEEVPPVEQALGQELKYVNLSTDAYNQLFDSKKNFTLSKSISYQQDLQIGDEFSLVQSGGHVQDLEFTSGKLEIVDGKLMTKEQFLGKEPLIIIDSVVAKNIQIKVGDTVELTTNMFLENNVFPIKYKVKVVGVYDSKKYNVYGNMFINNVIEEFLIKATAVAASNNLDDLKNIKNLAVFNAANPFVEGTSTVNPNARGFDQKMQGSDGPMLLTINTFKIENDDGKLVDVLTKSQKIENTYTKMSSIKYVFENNKYQLVSFGLMLGFMSILILLFTIGYSLIERNICLTRKREFAIYIKFGEKVKGVWQQVSFENTLVLLTISVVLGYILSVVSQFVVSLMRSFFGNYFPSYAGQSMELSPLPQYSSSFYTPIDFGSSNPSFILVYLFSIILIILIIGLVAYLNLRKLLRKVKNEQIWDK
ncbi:MAG: hypothetical protein ACRCUP_03155 [Mycoplasmatales bacterium]